MMPTVPAPCPRDTRQDVAMTRPTETEITSFRPSFFSSIISESFQLLLPAPFPERAAEETTFYSAFSPWSPVRTRMTLSSL